MIYWFKRIAQRNMETTAIETGAKALAEINAEVQPLFHAAVMKALVKKIVTYCEIESADPDNTVKVWCNDLTDATQQQIIISVKNLLKIPDMTTRPLTPAELDQIAGIVNAVRTSANGNTNYYDTLISGLAEEEKQETANGAFAIGEDGKLDFTKWQPKDNTPPEKQVWKQTGGTAPGKKELTKEEFAKLGTEEKIQYNNAASRLGFKQL